MGMKGQAAVRLVIAASFIGLAALSPASAKVLATVNGVEVTDDDVKMALEDLGPNLPAQLKGPQRDAYALDYLIDLKLVAAQATKDKLSDGPDFARKLAYYHDKVLMETMLGNGGQDSCNRRGRTQGLRRRRQDQEA